MAGFWVKTEMGNDVHINGEPTMSAETLQAITGAMDTLAAQYNRRGMTDEQKEAISAYMFQTYGNWARLLLKIGEETEDGCLRIPAYKVKWMKRMMVTSYDNLSDNDKYEFEEIAEWVECVINPNSGVIPF